MPTPTIVKLGSFNPASIQPKLPFWFEADYGITTVSGAVSAWENRGAQGGSATEGTALNRPTYSQTGGNGGTPKLVFDGTNSRMATAALNLPAANTLTYFAVVKRNATGAYHAIFTMNKAASSGLSMYFAGATQQAWQTDDLFATDNGFLSGIAPQVVVGATGSAVAGNGSPHVLQATLGTSGTFMLIDNTAYAYRVNSTGTPSAETSKVFNIGWDGFADFANVDLQAIIIGCDLNTSDQSNLYRYLSRKYAVL